MFIVHLEHGTELRDEGHAAGPEVLTDGHLLEEDGHAAEEHGHGVHQQEGTCNGSHFFVRDLQSGQFKL